MPMTYHRLHAGNVSVLVEHKHNGRIAGHHVALAGEWSWNHDLFMFHTHCARTSRRVAQGLGVQHCETLHVVVVEVTRHLRKVPFRERIHAPSNWRDICVL